MLPGQSASHKGKPQKGSDPVERLGRRAGSSFLLRIAAAGMTYIFVVVMTRIMETADFGVVGTLISASLLFSAIGSLGQRPALVRFIPPLISIGQSTGPLLGLAFRLGLLGNLLVYLLLATSVLVAGAVGTIDNMGLIIFGLLLVPLTGMIDIQTSVALAHRALVIGQLPKDVLWRAITVIAAIGLYVVFDKPVSLGLVLLLLVSVLFVLLLVQALLIRKAFGVPVLLAALRSKKGDFNETPWLRARVPFWAASIVETMYGSFDVVVVGVLLGPVEAALYFVVNRVALLLNLFEHGVNVVVSPLMSARAEAGDQEGLAEVARSAVVQFFLPTFFCGSVLIFAAPQVLGIFGPDYVKATMALRILLLGRILLQGFGACEVLLSMAGLERRAMWLAVLNLVLSAAFICIGAWFWGIEGTALGLAAGAILRKMLYWQAAKKVLGVRTDIVHAVSQALRGRT